MSDKAGAGKDGPIGWIIFNQPEKRNAVSQEMWQLMPDYIQDLRQTTPLRVVILRGAGERAFVAGADISQFKDHRRNAADAEAEYSKISARAQESLRIYRNPVSHDPWLLCGVASALPSPVTCALRPTTHALAFQQRAWAWGITTTAWKSS